MALFGLPGGAEWIIIVGIIVLLFVPGVLMFWFGYFTGKNAATKEWNEPAAQTTRPHRESYATHHTDVLSDDTDPEDSDA